FGESPRDLDVGGVGEVDQALAGRKGGNEAPEGHQPGMTVSTRSPPSCQESPLFLIAWTRACTVPVVVPVRTNEAAMGCSGSEPDAQLSADAARLLPRVHD